MNLYIVSEKISARFTINLSTTHSPPLNIFIIYFKRFKLNQLTE